MKIFQYIIAVFFLTMMFLNTSCGDGKNGSRTDNPNTNKVNKEKYCKIISPANNAVFKTGDEIIFQISSGNKTADIDSILYFAEKERIYSSTDVLTEFKWNTLSQKTGKRLLRLDIFYKNKEIESHSISLTLLSSIKPQNYTYTLIKKYPHDPQAFTQGLVVHKGFLYEGTGQYGSSSIRKVNIINGEVEKIHRNENQFFGEGITIFKDKLIQITWREGTGFVYDLETFDMIRQFNYIYKGWGLCNDEKRLISSDGTETIHFIDPDNYIETGRLEVYDNFGPVFSLNELEYIDGKIYANIYETKKIVQIDPQTGAVLAYIDLNGLLEKKDVNGHEEHLNGIAYDKETEKLYVTGKYYSYLYEIRLIEVNQ